MHTPSVRRGRRGPLGAVVLAALALLAPWPRPATAQFIPQGFAQGSLTNANDAVSILTEKATTGRSLNCGVQITGAWIGTLKFEGTIDQVNWFGISTTSLPGGVLSTVGTFTVVNGQWVASCAGLRVMRVRADNMTTGTATVSIVMTP